MPFDHTDDDPCTTVHLPHGTGAATRARHLMVPELLEHGVRRSVITDAEIVLGELVMNACEHGQPDGQGNVEISWCLDSDRLRISVIDGGHVADLHPVELSDDSLRGRGLHMVDDICRTWSTDHTRGTRVTAELDFGLEGA
jgi:serine/threonine-protein kinase RsbW